LFTLSIRNVSGFSQRYNKNSWNPSSFETIGLGSTEKAIYNLTKELAKYSEYYIWVVGNIISGDFDNVKYRTIEQFKQEQYE
jgi:ribulose bisphosphate carboxylase small subunit